MEISEKVAYLKGLAEGLNLDTDSKEGTLIAAIIDVLELHDLHDLAVHLEGLAVSEITGGNSCHIDIPPIVYEGISPFPLNK